MGGIKPLLYHCPVCKKFVVEFYGLFQKIDKRIDPENNLKKFNKNYIHTVLLPGMGFLMNLYILRNLVAQILLFIKKDEAEKSVWRGFFWKQNISDIVVFNLRILLDLQDKIS